MCKWPLLLLKRPFFFHGGLIARVIWGGLFFKRSTEGRAVNCRKITNVTGPIVQTTKESQEDINDTPPRKLTACYRRGKQHCSPFLLNNRPHYHYISMATSIEKTLLSSQRQRQHLPQGKGHSEVKIISSSSSSSHSSSLVPIIK